MGSREGETFVSRCATFHYWRITVALDWPFEAFAVRMSGKLARPGLLLGSAEVAGTSIHDVK